MGLPEWLDGFLARVGLLPPKQSCRGHSSNTRMRWRRLVFPASPFRFALTYSVDAAPDRRRWLALNIVRKMTRAQSLSKPRLKLVTPPAVNRTVMPRRRPNADLRTREHLMEAEVERLIAAAKANRHGHRDAAMVLLA
jgi:hypothetical protein